MSILTDIFNPATKIFTAEDVKINRKGTGIGSIFYESLKKFGTNTAQIDLYTGKQETYAEVFDKSVRTSMKLKSVGFKEDDILTICSENNLEVIKPFIAAQLLGGVLANLDASQSINDIKFLLKKTDPKFIFVSENCEEKMSQAVKLGGLKSKIVVFGKSVDNLEFDSFVSHSCDVEKFRPVEKDESDTAIIFFSSGTTGMPKGICVSHCALIHQADSYLGFANTKVNLPFASVYWISSSLLVIQNISNGHCTIQCRVFQTKIVWNALEKHKVTTLLPSPILALRLIKQKYESDTTHLVNILIGGSSVTKDNILKLKESFPSAKVTYMYGQSELGICMYFNCKVPKHLELAEKYPVSVGVPCAGYSVKIVDPECEEILGPNKIGEIRVLTKYRMNGYYYQDSSDVFDADGFIKTGDLGYYNDDRCFFVIDRIKEMFKYQGWHIVPIKIESVMLRHPEVQEAVVIGVPDPVDEHHALGIVVRKEGATVTERDIEEFVNEKTEDDRYRLRRGVKFVEKIPYTPSGKVKRMELKNIVMRNL